MSRFSATQEDTYIIYGLDHILGWFFEEWPVEYFPDSPTIEKNNISNGALLELLEGYDNVPSENKMSIAMDLDPEIHAHRFIKEEVIDYSPGWEAGIIPMISDNEY